ncbi:MAG: MFS transporter [Dehalococcoidia bacterium]
MAFLRLLRRPHLALLWLSQVLSSAGDNFYNVAIVWTAVNVAGASAGFVIAAGSVTRIILGPIGGALADRWDRHRCLVATDVGRAVVVGILPLINAAGTIELWHLAVVAVLLNGLGTVFDPALQASLPSLVGDRSQIVAMNGLMDGTRRLALALAPSLAGVLVAVLPLTQFFTLDAATFLFSAAALVAIGRHFARERELLQARAAVGPGDIYRDIVVAVGLVRRNVVLSFFLMNQVISNTAWAATFQVGAALLASRVFDGNVGSYGLILGAYGAGNILSNVVVGNLTITRPALLLSSARLVQAAGIFVIALSGSLPVAMAGSFVVAIGGPMADLMLLQVIHHDTPSGQIGKVFALRVTISSVGVFAGLLLAGPLYALLSPRNGIAVCAVVMVLAGVLGFMRFGLGKPPVEVAPREAAI